MTTEQSDDRGLLLAGLDGSNPLAFLAALGTFRTLALVRPGEQPRMSWSLAGTWHPLIDCPACPTAEALIETLLEYNEALKTASPDARAPTFDFAGVGDIIGVAPDVFDEFTAEAMARAGSDRPLRSRREPLDFVAGFGTTFCLTSKGTVEPSLFSFANGQSGQCLLRSFRALRDSLTRDLLERSLLHPWDYEDPRPTLRWDPSDCRPYAHLATDPGNSRSNPVRTMSGANYLAFLALSLLPSVPSETGLRTTGFTRQGRAWYWTWPIWDVPQNIDCVRSLLALAELQQDVVPRRRLRACGVPQVFRSRRFTHQKGVYFSPSRSG